jgi:acyl carrier protein
MTARETEILERVRGLMQATLQLSDAEAAALNRASTPATVDGWTSMAHLDLVLAVEKQFDVVFDADEIAHLASLDAIVAALLKRP